MHHHQLQFSPHLSSTASPHLHSLQSSLHLSLPMTTKGNSQVFQRPGEVRTTIPHKRSPITRPIPRSLEHTRSCGFRLPKRPEFTPLRFVKNLGGKVVKGIRLAAARRNNNKPLPNVSSSSGRSKSFVTPIDSHRAEAIEDCIEFINSSSLTRSNSVSANPC